MGNCRESRLRRNSFFRCRGWTKIAGPYFGKREEIFELSLGLEIVIVEDKMKLEAIEET